MNHVRMDRRSIVIAGLAVMTIALGAGCSSTVEEEPAETSADAVAAWPCYNPQPGHPTADEKTRFIAAHAWFAQEAERRYNVPAAALLAMASNEGGYGFTRTGLYAKNSFGWKYYGATSAGGRAPYTLACQPAWDVGNQYVTFASIGEGILFVGQKLATLPSYSADAIRYKADRVAGVDVVTAVNRFIDAIAEPYNYDPPTYRATIKRHANNYMTPSAVKSPDRNLYQYSAAITF